MCLTSHKIRKHGLSRVVCVCNLVYINKIIYIIIVIYVSLIKVILTVPFENMIFNIRDLIKSIRFRVGFSLD